MTAQVQMFGFTPVLVKPCDEQQAEISRLKMELHKAQKKAANAQKVCDEKSVLNAELQGRLASQNKTIMELCQMVKQLQAQQTDTGKSSIPAEMWRRLVQLCHPDRHSNSDAATLATQWLNKVRP